MNFDRKITNLLPISSQGKKRILQELHEEKKLKKKLKTTKKTSAGQINSL